MITVPSSAFADEVSGIAKPKAAKAAIVNAILRIFSSIIPMMASAHLIMLEATKLFRRASPSLNFCSDYDDDARDDTNP